MRAVYLVDQNVYGTTNSWHAVKMIGWGEEKRHLVKSHDAISHILCRLVANLWGCSWGQNGKHDTLVHKLSFLPCRIFQDLMR